MLHFFSRLPLISLYGINVHEKSSLFHRTRGLHAIAVTLQGKYHFFDRHRTFCDRYNFYSVAGDVSGVELQLAGEVWQNCWLVADHPVMLSDVQLQYLT